MPFPTFQQFQNAKRAYITWTTITPTHVICGKESWRELEMECYQMASRITPVPPPETTKSVDGCIVLVDFERRSGFHFANLA
jgi:hypothetical protein